MNEVKHKEDNKVEQSEKSSKKERGRKTTQGQMIQETLGLKKLKKNSLSFAFLISFLKILSNLFIKDALWNKMLQN